MRYHAPFGESNPDAPYVDRNTPGAIRGSVPPAAAIEDPQREIVDVIVKAGLVPADGLQLAPAIQSGKLNYAPAGGTANALTATLSPAITAYADGLMVMIKPALANASTAPTLALNGLAAKPIQHLDGGGLIPGELGANAPFLVAYSATADAFVLIGGVSRKQLVDRTPFVTRPGYFTLPNSGLSYSTANISFSTAFATACVGVLITANRPVAGDGWVGIPWADNVTASGCRLSIDTNGTKIISQTVPVTYIAIGY